MRLSPEVDALVSEEAARTRRSKGAVIEALAAEALRTRLFPGIAFRGVDWERRAWVMGTAFDVWQVIEAHQDFGSVEAMAAEGTLSERQIRLALAYYEQFPAEIDEFISRNRQPIEVWQAAFPSIAVNSAPTR